MNRTGANDMIRATMKALQNRQLIAGTHSVATMNGREFTGTNYIRIADLTSVNGCRVEK